jgi:hypothetical protein
MRTIASMKRGTLLKLADATEWFQENLLRRELGAYTGYLKENAASRAP